MIGVAGGAGPLAGGDLCNKIMEETLASVDQEHLPLILLSFPQLIPDRTEYLLGKVQQNPAFAIGSIFLQLEKAGATIAAIPCNTAHAPAIFDVLLKYLKENNSQLTVINMIGETVRYLKTIRENAAIGVLSTTGTKMAGIYRLPLQNAGFTVIEPGEELQASVHAAIYDERYGIKANATPVSERAKQVLTGAAAELISHGAEIILLGCTELPLAITESMLHQQPVIDPNRVLARAMIEAFEPSKLRVSAPAPNELLR